MRSKAMAASGSHAVAHEVVHHLTLDALRNANRRTKTRDLLSKIEKLLQALSRVIRLAQTRKGKTLWFEEINALSSLQKLTASVKFSIRAMQKIP
jgi:hypothetical protein